MGKNAQKRKHVKEQKPTIYLMVQEPLSWEDYEGQPRGIMGYPLSSNIYTLISESIYNDRETPGLLHACLSALLRQTLEDYQQLAELALVCNHLSWREASRGNLEVAANLDTAWKTISRGYRQKYGANEAAMRHFHQVCSD